MVEYLDKRGLAYLWGKIRDRTLIPLILKVSTFSEVNSPEWRWVVLDSEDKIVMGVRRDYSWYVSPADTSDLTDAVTDAYDEAGRAYGSFADKPASPDIGQQYFCTDRQTTEGVTNGIPIYWNGTVWTDALGRTVS